MVEGRLGWQSVLLPQSRHVTQVCFASYYLLPICCCQTVLENGTHTGTPQGRTGYKQTIIALSGETLRGEQQSDCAQEAVCVA